MTKEITINTFEPIISEVSGLTIGGSADMEIAVELLSQLNKASDQVEEDKKKLTDPANAILKDVRSRYKPLETALDASITSLKAKMTSYQAQALKERAGAEQKLVERVGEGRGSLKIETAVRKIGELEGVEKKVEGESGAVTFVEVKKFEVTDMAKLPLQFHLANETEIRRLMNQGIEIEGVRYYTEQSVRNKR